MLIISQPKKIRKKTYFVQKYIITGGNKKTKTTSTRKMTSIIKDINRKKTGENLTICSGFSLSIIS